MKKIQSGFTLIELVVVIVILGILAVTAVPRFINLSAQAEQAAVEGVAGALSSASAINYAARSAGDTTNTVAIATCADVAGALAGGALPLDSAGASYAVTEGTFTDGVATDCELAHSTGTPTANFTAIQIP